MKIIGISGSLCGSKTRVAVSKTLEMAAEINPKAEIELIDLKEYDLEFCTGKELSHYNTDTQRLVETIAISDIYIVGTPIFQGSIPGALKNVFDLCEPEIFRGKTMGFLATGGTFHHYLVIENHLKPIAGYFRSHVAPGSVYIQAGQFNAAGDIVDADALKRLRGLAEEVVSLGHFSATMNNRIQCKVA
jgi:FMN reductase/FAD reductase [NAD(P)H]